jgi:hypothetical protein
MLAGVAASGPSSHEEPPGGPPPGDPPVTPQARPRRRGLFAGLGALVLVIAAVGGWLIWHTSQPSSANSSMNTGMHSPLMTALTNASKATKMLPMMDCHSHSTTVVTCAHPNFAVTTVTFRTYPSLKALYAAYVADVRNMGDTQGNSIRINFGNCSQDITTGEVSWNHNHVHPRNYSLAQSISGMLDPSTQAAGRVSCTISTSSGLYQLVWTQDAGRLLATLTGGPHDAAWRWWRAIHHNIQFPGTPQMHM